MLDALQFVALVFGGSVLLLLFPFLVHWGLSALGGCDYCADKRQRLHSLAASWFCKDCGWVSNHVDGHVLQDRFDAEELRRMHEDARRNAPFRPDGAS